MILYKEIFASRWPIAAGLRPLFLSLALLLTNAAGLSAQSAQQADTARILTLPDQMRPDGTYIFVQTMPRFKGDLQAFLSKTIRYPAAADHATGKTITQFVVNEKGKVRSIRVVKSSGSAAMDKEAVRVIGKMPSWEPGRTAAGKAVPVLFTLPITIDVE